MQITYAGPHDEVEIPALGVVVRRGEPFEATGDLAQSLLEQSDNFRRGGGKNTASKE